MNAILVFELIGNVQTLIRGFDTEQYFHDWYDSLSDEYKTSLTVYGRLEYLHSAGCSFCDS